MTDRDPPVTLHVSIGLPTDRVDFAEQFVSQQGVSEIARAVEEMGYDACWVTDHPAADARWLGAGGHHALDPFVALSFAAAATTRLRLHTHILVAAYRNPLLTAKSVLSLDVLSGGRVMLGVASGYLRREFTALGVDFEERNERTNESIEVLRRVWERGQVTYDGHGFASSDVVMRPRPSNQRLPIWVGGNSLTAMRRAVALGDGWAPFPNVSTVGWKVRTPILESIEQLEDRVTTLRDLCESAGRARPPEVMFSPFSLLPSITGSETFDAARVRAELSRLRKLGVTWCVINPPRGDTRGEYLAGAEKLMLEVIQPFRTDESAR